jgi:hypothetical protein
MLHVSNVANNLKFCTGVWLDARTAPDILKTYDILKSVIFMMFRFDKLFPDETCGVCWTLKMLQHAAIGWLGSTRRLASEQANLWRAVVDPTFSHDSLKNA